MEAERELDKRDAEADLKLCEAATPGPWELEPEADDDEGLVIWRKDAEHPGRSEGVIVLNPDCHYEEADITFITEAREALPHWIERAQEAEAEAARLREALGQTLIVEQWTHECFKALIIPAEVLHAIEKQKQALYKK